jgi:hypothetical protein
MEREVPTFEISDRAGLLPTKEQVPTLAPQPTTKQGHHQEHSVQVDCGRDIQLSSGREVDNDPMNYSPVANNDLSHF